MPKGTTGFSSLRSRNVLSLVYLAQKERGTWFVVEVPMGSGALPFVPPC